MGLVMVGAACCFRAYIGLQGVHAVAPVPVLKGETPTWVMTGVDQLMRVFYIGIGLIGIGVGVAVANALFVRAGRKASATAEST